MRCDATTSVSVNKSLAQRHRLGDFPGERCPSALFLSLAQPLASSCPFGHHSDSTPEDGNLNRDLGADL